MQETINQPEQKSKSKELSAYDQLLSEIEIWQRLEETEDLAEFKDFLKNLIEEQILPLIVIEQLRQHFEELKEDDQTNLKDLLNKLREVESYEQKLALLETAAIDLESFISNVKNRLTRELERELELVKPALESES